MGVLRVKRAFCAEELMGKRCERRAHSSRGVRGARRIGLNDPIAGPAVPTPPRFPQGAVQAPCHESGQLLDAPAAIHRQDSTGDERGLVRT